MRVSVIIATYNQPEWLEKALRGYTVQATRPLEILIADDGSDERTREVIERSRSLLDMPLRHVWHEDNGFQKCTILNRAIEEAVGDYLYFTDGDCIPSPDLLATHAGLAAPGRFLSGGSCRLPMNASQAIDFEDVLSGRAFDLNWLGKHGMPASSRAWRLGLSASAASWLDRLTPTRPTFNGNNSSAWRDDVLRVGGFDERMAYGGLDRELGERLENSGVKGKQVRHRAICLHLDHARAYENGASWQRNKEIRQVTRSERKVFTEWGIRPAA